LVIDAARSTHRYLSEAEREAVTSYLRDLQRFARELVEMGRDADALSQALDVDVVRGLATHVERALQEKMDLCHGILSSIRRVPSEIMALIFELYTSEDAPSDDEMDIEDQYSQACGETPARSSPFVICQVCKAWQTIAMRHRALWARPTIRIQLGDVLQVTETHAQAIEMWMERIGGNPWSLRLIMGGWARATMRHSTTRTKRPSDPRGSPLYHLIPSNAVDTLNNLHIVHRDNMYVETRLEGMSFPQLRSLVVDMEAPVSLAADPWYWGDDGERVADLPEMPNLKEAVLYGMSFRAIPPHLPWGRMTRLCIGGERGVFTNILQVLRACTNLVEACFVYTAFQGVEGETPTTAHHIEAPALRKLTFIGPSVPLSLPYPKISFPGLNTLTTVFKELKQWHLSNLSTFEPIVDLYLESLAIDTTRMAIHTSIFAAYSSLTRLTLNLSLPYGDLFQALTFAPVASPVPGPGPHLPRLEKLGIQIELDPYPCYKCSGFGEMVVPTHLQPIPSAPEQFLVRMLESRTLAVDDGRHQCARLKIFTIRVCPRSGGGNSRNRNDVIADRIRVALHPLRDLLNIYQSRGHSDYLYERTLGHWSDGFAESIERIRTL
jgi:hypothetical protein